MESSETLLEKKSGSDSQGHQDPNIASGSGQDPVHTQEEGQKKVTSSSTSTNQISFHRIQTFFTYHHIKYQAPPPPFEIEYDDDEDISPDPRDSAAHPNRHLEDDDSDEESANLPRFGSLPDHDSDQEEDQEVQRNFLSFEGHRRFNIARTNGILPLNRYVVVIDGEVDDSLPSWMDKITNENVFELISSSLEWISDMFGLTTVRFPEPPMPFNRLDVAKSYEISTRLYNRRIKTLCIFCARLHPSRRCRVPPRGHHKFIIQLYNANLEAHEVVNKKRCLECFHIYKFHLRTCSKWMCRFCKGFHR